MIRATTLLSVGAGLAMLASPVQACSFSWRPGYSPAEIRSHDDVQKLTGRFVLEQGFGEVSADGALVRGEIRGHIVTHYGAKWPTVHEYDEFSAQCGALLTPTADAEGRFWLTLDRTKGRYTLLMWQGEYLPSNHVRVSRSMPATMEQ